MGKGGFAIASKLETRASMNDESCGSRTPGLAVQKGGIETARLPNFSNRDYRQRERERESLQFD